MIITLGRQHGSNGHDIARALAKELDYRCFDKEIVEEAAENSHFSKEIFDSYDEKRVNAYIVPVPHYVGMNEGFRLNMQVATAQFDVMRSLAEKGNCIFVGRCADYILAGRDNTINVFVYAPREVRVNRIMARHNLSEAEALKAISTSDKERGNHYFRYTDQKWGKAQNYDVCINSGLMGIEKTAEMLADMAKIEVRA